MAKEIWSHRQGKLDFTGFIIFIPSTYHRPFQIVLRQEPPDAETKKNTAIRMNGFESLASPKFDASVKLVSRR